LGDELVKRILLIDDDTTIHQVLTTPLEHEGYEVFAADTGRKGLDIAKDHDPDLVILDMVMPKMDGLETGHRLRELGIQSILVIGPADDEGSVVKSLKMGADDYLAKPIQVPILLARVRMLMRRKPVPVPNAPSSYDNQELSIDLETQRVELRGNPVRLTHTEFKLLSVLLRRVGRVVTHEQLIQEIWGTDKKTSLGSLKLYVHYVRQKIEDNPRKPYYLLSEWGVGYRLRRP
jgi:two-component system KDP operon response regulator KdpE